MLPSSVKKLLTKQIIFIIFTIKQIVFTKGIVDIKTRQNNFVYYIIV
jgi:hypothetical protein